MFQKRILWFMDWQGSQEDFTKVSENAEFNWDFTGQWHDAVEKIQWSHDNNAPFAVAFVDAFEKAEWIWKIDPNVQCVIWAESNWDWAQNFKKFDQWDKWLVMKRPFAEWEAWQAAKSMWRKWELEQQAFKNQGAPKERRILVVDDENQIREMVSEMLQQAGFQVFTASSGDEALKLFGDPSFKVDLLLTDVVMPKVTGTRLAEAVRQNHPWLPIVFMSGFPRDQQFQKDVEDGQKRFLQKPFNNSSLLSAIQSAFSGDLFASGKWSSPARWEA